jgi:hypothetical protein
MRSRGWNKMCRRPASSRGQKIRRPRKMVDEFDQEQQIFDRALKEIRRRRFASLPRVIRLVRDAYVEHLGCDAKTINQGWCEDFAVEVIYCLRRSVPVTRAWDDELTGWYEEELTGWHEEDLCGSHCFLCYKGRFYDSEAPDGVEDWRELPHFIRQQAACSQETASRS